jgi:Leucine-rich repeat (LRR) protein
MNSLTSVPGSIAELPCLDLLCVQYNKLTSLPVSILSWEKPKELSLMRNTEELSRMARKVHKETRKFKLP